MFKLLIVSHSPSTNAKALTDAVVKGASNKEIDNVDILLRPPLQANADDVLAADGIILGTTENFGYMSGAMKDFFDRIYNPCLQHTQGLPYALFVKAGVDGEGAKSSIERIVTGLRWKQAQACLICKGEFKSDFLLNCEELGMTMAAGIEAGIF
jgi:multimeric flavodoxin WrbA